MTFCSLIYFCVCVCLQITESTSANGVVKGRKPPFPFSNPRLIPPVLPSAHFKPFRLNLRPPARCHYGSARRLIKVSYFLSLLSHIPGWTLPAEMKSSGNDQGGGGGGMMESRWSLSKADVNILECKLCKHTHAELQSCTNHMKICFNHQSLVCIYNMFCKSFFFLGARWMRSRLGLMPRIIWYLHCQFHNFLSDSRTMRTDRSRRTGTRG